MSSLSLLPLLVLVVGGCASSDEPLIPPAGCGANCADPDRIGVPLQPECDQTYCAGDAPCASTVEVTDDAGLAAATATAAAGTCIALAPGTYGAVTLPGGVSLLGRWADEVSVGAVLVEAGSGAMLRGMTAAGVQLDGAEDVQLEAMRMQGGDMGLHVAAGSSFSLRRSEIVGAQSYALVGADLVSATIERTHIHDITGPGVWLQCSAGCDCVTLPQLQLDRVHIEDVQHVGMNLVGVHATLRSVDIINTTALSGQEGGGGLAINTCSEFDVRDLTIDGADSYGALVDGSTGNLGAAGDEQGIIIVDGKIGVWLQGTEQGQSITVEQFELAGNAGVGLGIGPGAQGIIIVDGKISDTMSVALPVHQGGQEQVGDGLLWRQGAQVNIDGLTFANSARHPFLIDGDVGMDSSIDNITLTGGDEAKGIIHQNATEGPLAGAEVGANVPGIQLFDGADPFGVADAPEGPSTPQ